MTAGDHIWELKQQIERLEAENKLLRGMPPPHPDIYIRCPVCDRIQGAVGVTEQVDWGGTLFEVKQVITEQFLRSANFPLFVQKITARCGELLLAERERLKEGEGER